MVEQNNATRLRMNADMADSSNLVKHMLIKAEDVRILGGMKAMRRTYRQLYDLNMWVGGYVGMPGRQSWLGLWYVSICMAVCMGGGRVCMCMCLLVVFKNNHNVRPSQRGGGGAGTAQQHPIM